MLRLEADNVSEYATLAGKVKFFSAPLLFLSSLSSWCFIAIVSNVSFDLHSIEHMITESQSNH